MGTDPVAVVGPAVRPAARGVQASSSSSGDMADHGERLAVLESKIERVEQSQNAIMDKLEKIDLQLTRYHGFLGGAAFLVTGIGVGWNLLGDWIKSQLQ